MARHRKEKVRRRSRSAVALSAVASAGLVAIVGAHLMFSRPAALEVPLSAQPSVAVRLVTGSTPTPSETTSPSPPPTPTRPAPKPTPPFTRTLRVGDSGPLVADLQNRLNWAGTGVRVSGVFDNATVRAVKHFQAKHNLAQSGRVDRSAYGLVVALTKRKAGLDPRCGTTGAVLCVDKSQEVLRYLVDGVPKLIVDVRFGSAELPTREGVFHVYYKSRYHVSNLFHTPMPFAMFFSGGQAVHYSKYFAAVGYNGHSHGCVNVRDLAAVQQLFDEVAVGTEVVIYRTI